IGQTSLSVADPKPLPDPLRQLAIGPVFIVGQFRSGTTWVYDILTAHPEVGGAFESRLFTFADGIASLFTPRHFEHQVELLGTPHGVGQLITRERLASDVRELASGWLAAALQPRHRFLVEKTPDHYESMHVIAEIFP